MKYLQLLFLFLLPFAWNGDEYEPLIQPITVLVFEHDSFNITEYRAKRLDTILLVTKKLLEEKAIQNVMLVNLTCAEETERNSLIFYSRAENVMRYALEVHEIDPKYFSLQNAMHGINRWGLRPCDSDRIGVGFIFQSE